MDKQGDSEKEEELWGGVVEMLDCRQKELEREEAFLALKEPKSLSYLLSRYKFISKLISGKGSVLEYGCRYGIGTALLLEQVERYVGISEDGEFISYAKREWGGERAEFHLIDEEEKGVRKFDVLIALELSKKEEFSHFFSLVDTKNGEHSLVVLGIDPSNFKLVGSYFEELFFNIFPFSMYGEVVRGGVDPSAEFLILLGCHKRGSNFYANS